MLMPPPPAAAAVVVVVPADGVFATLLSWQTLRHRCLLVSIPLPPISLLSVYVRVGKPDFVAVFPVRLVRTGTAVVWFVGGQGERKQGAACRRTPGSAFTVIKSHRLGSTHHLLLMSDWSIGIHQG